MTTTTGHQPEATTNEVPPQERVTRRDLAEGNAEKVVNERTEAVSLFKGGGVDYDNLRDMVDAAKLLSSAGPMIPPWLQGNVGGMFGICMKAQELGISPLSLANWSYVVEQTVAGAKVARVSYESQFFHSVIEARAPITGRLQVSYEGSGDARKCRVFATFKGEKEPRYFPPLDADPDQFTLGKLRPKANDQGNIKGSPLWTKKPDLQLFYNMSRDWARMYCPDVIAGMYGRDEMEDAGFEVASDVARDVSPKLAHRLRGPTGEGFEHSKSSIEASIAAASTVDPKAKNTSTSKAGDDPVSAASGSEGAPSAPAMAADGVAE